MSFLDGCNVRFINRLEKLARKRTYQAAARAAGLGRLGTHFLRHRFRTWLDSVGTPVGVQQTLMRHADIGATMNIYGEAVRTDMAKRTAKSWGLRLHDCQLIVAGHATVYAHVAGRSREPR